MLFRPTDHVGTARGQQKTHTFVWREVFYTLVERFRISRSYNRIMIFIRSAKLANGFPLEIKLVLGYSNFGA